MREVVPKADSGVSPDGTATPVTNDLVDIAKPGGEDALKQVLGLIDGQAVDAELFDLLRAGGIDKRTLFDGESLLGIAVNDGALAAKLEEAGHITITDGKIALATGQGR